MSWPSAKPQMNGTATPATEMLSAALPTFRTSLRSVSIPVSSSSRRMPNCAMPSSMAFCSGAFGKMACCKAGQSTPSTEGPSTMPPSSIPMTDGWPMRFMTSPRRRPTSISVMSCTRKMTSDAPAEEPCAAPAAAALSPSAAPAHSPVRKQRRAEVRRTVGQVMDLRHPRALNPAGQRMFPFAPRASACGDFSEPPGDAAPRLPCNCKLFATRLWRWRRIVSMAVSSVPEERSSSSPAHSETGWRHSRSTPSLSEVFGSVATRPKGPLWKKLMAFLGPGYLVAVGYMDPGNWATSLAGGSKFGYALLTIALLSNLMAILLQALCARLGIGAGRDLAQACRDAFPRAVAWPLWLMAEVAICATDLAEVIGTAIGLNLLFGIPLEIGVIITALDVFLILAMQRLGFRWIEAFIVTLLGVIAVCFAIQIALAHPDWRGVILGFAPTVDIIRNPEMLYLSLGILGATVMPHNLYLHSGVVQTR